MYTYVQQTSWMARLENSVIMRVLFYVLASVSSYGIWCDAELELLVISCHIRDPSRGKPRFELKQFSSAIWASIA